MLRCDLHNHTKYSNLRLLDALPSPEDLINRALELNLKGVAITDHEILSAHPAANKYHQEVLKDNPDFKVILGNEIYLVDERPSKTHYHFILLAKDKIGHRQLRELSSYAWLYSYGNRKFTRVDTTKEELKKIVSRNPGHLIAATACIGGELGQSILALTKAEKLGDTEGAKESHNKIVNFILFCKELFKDDFYLEAQPGVSNEQIIVNKKLIPISKEFNVKIIPTSDTHYLKENNRPLHKTFLNSKDEEREVDDFYKDTYLHSNEEMIEKFNYSEYDKDFVLEMFKNTMEIYDKIENYSLFHTQQVPAVPVPNIEKKAAPADIINYPTLSKMYMSDDEVDRYWVNTCINKLRELDKFNEDYLEELEEEAEVKYVVGERLNTNMFSYPIALAYYINLIWETGSSVGAGRGSACSALNHYLLGITQLDPLEQGFPFFRYMNRDTDGLGDIDIDVSPSKIAEIVESIRLERGTRFSEVIDDKLIKDSLGAAYVCTFGTETSKSAVQTACRGYRSADYPDGIDSDVSQYLSSLIPQERGFVWSINDMVYGNEEKGRKPVKQFIQEVNDYPGLLEAILGIEGIISRRGRHASGVLFMGEDPFEYNAFMKTPSGEIVTQYDLHDAESCGSVKMDILVTSVQDKLVETLKFLQEDGLIEKGLTVKEMYDKYLHPDILPLDDEDTWKTIQEASSLDLFQLDSPIGRQGAKKVKPTSIAEMSATNGLIRLMTAEKGEETWLDKYVRFKNNPRDLRAVQIDYGLTPFEVNRLSLYVGSTYGIGISQEQLMRVLMDEELCGFTLKEANAARKIISKKRMTEIPTLKKKVIESAKSPSLARYIWDYIVAPGLGYSFSDIHSVSYSYVGFQTAYLATHWNPIYWNTACLVVNSNSLSSGGKDKSTDYGALAKAIGQTRSANINVSLANINESSFGFKPDAKNNRILFGLKGINKVGGDVVNKIIENRPYKGIKDFMNRCPLKKDVMISLIKSGAFNELDGEWAKEVYDGDPRIGIMAYYLMKISGLKTKLTLQNFSGLIKEGLIPDKFNFQKELIKYSKIIKSSCSDEDKKDLYLEGAKLDYFLEHFSEDDIDIVDSVGKISVKKWEKLYTKEMNKVKEWMAENQSEVLNMYNTLIFKESWDKYAKGKISTWEMDSLCFYYGEHELSGVNVNKYGVSDFSKLPETPEVEYFRKRKNHSYPIYKLTSIIGTVIDKDTTRSSVTLLTTTGVVTVKFNKEHFALFNRQMSEIQADGSKKIVEKSWFTKGSMIMVTGYRRNDTFVTKKYANTGRHQLYHITKIMDNGDIELISERKGDYGEEVD